MVDIDKVLRSGGPGALEVWRRETTRRGEDIMGALASIIDPSDLESLLGAMRTKTARQLKTLEDLIEDLTPRWEEWYRFQVISWLSFERARTEKGSRLTGLRIFADGKAQSKQPEQHQTTLYRWDSSNGYLKTEGYESTVEVCAAIACRDVCEQLGLFLKAQRVLCRYSTVRAVVQLEDNWHMEAQFDMPDGEAVEYPKIRDLVLNGLLDVRPVRGMAPLLRGI